MTGALAIFVKTPQLSPVKTRLASDLGEALAQEFYQRSLKVTQSLAKEIQENTSSLTAYWAVAEKFGLGHSLWNAFPTLNQGSGSLGERLAHVYGQLIERHDYVCFMGSDSPQVPLQDLLGLVESTRSKKGFVIGRSEDGGFYFFGGSLPLSTETWTTVPYSESNTETVLTHNLSAIGPVTFGETHFDIDTGTDFKRLAQLDALSNLSKDQVKLVRWAKEQCDVLTKPTFP